jgi:hypothetical protein
MIAGVLPCLHADGMAAKEWRVKGDVPNQLNFASRQFVQPVSMQQNSGFGVQVF